MGHKELQKRLLIQVHEHLDEEWQLYSLDELRHHLARIRNYDFAELWLNMEGLSGFLMLINNVHRRTFLLEMETLHTMASDYTEDADWVQAIIASGEDHTQIEFMLGNGQVDDIAMKYTVPLEQGLKAFEYFFVHGESAPFLEWSDSELDL